MADNQTVEIKKYSELEKEMNAYKVECETLVFDYNDPKGNEDARSLVFKGSRINAAIEKTRKALKSKSLEEGRLVDSTAKEYTEKHQLSMAIHRDPIQKLEAEEKEKIAKIAEANKLKAEIEDAEREAYLEKGERELAAKEKALQDKADELKAAEDKLANDKLVADAAKQATIDAEAKAKSDALIASAKAEQDRIAAVEAEKTRQLKEEVAKRKEEERLEDEELKRISDKQHIEQVKYDAWHAIRNLVSEDSEASDIIEKIANGDIPHISIQY